MILYLFADSCACSLRPPASTSAPAPALGPDLTKSAALVEDTALAHEPDATGLRARPGTGSGVRSCHGLGPMLEAMPCNPCPSPLGDDGTLGPVPQLLGEHEDATTVSGEVDAEPVHAPERICE